MSHSKSVAILSYDGQAFFELGCAVEVFALPRDDIEGWYHGEVVTFEAQAQRATGGVHLTARVVSNFDAYSMVVIPSWPTHEACIPRELADACLRAYKRKTQFLSFCSGAFLLAELGLLDGRKVTTHWRYANTFQKRFPHLTYSHNVLFEYDGDIGCSAGSAAGLDLGLEVIRQDFGFKVANTVARRLIISAQRSGGQAQFVETPVVTRRNALSNIVDWVMAHLDREIRVDDLAEKAHMSRRSFDRKFKESFGVSPKSWLIEQRLQRVLLLLENTDDNVSDIASQCGFESAIAMRHHFRKRFDITPTIYRSNFSRRIEHV